MGKQAARHSNTAPSSTAVRVLLAGVGLAGLAWSMHRVLSMAPQGRREAEEALPEGEELFRTLFRQSPDSMLLLDPQTPDGVWRIVDCNEAACRMNGFTREEMLGQPINIYLPAPADPQILAAHLERLRRLGADHREVLHRRKDGTLFTLDASISLISLGGRELILGIDRDTTERKRLELLAQAEEAVKARNEFLSIVSHELKTPLTVLKGHVQMLCQRARQESNESMLRQLEVVNRQSDRMVMLIDDLLDVSRIEAGRLQFEMSPFDLAAAVRETTEEVASSRRDFQLRVEGYPDNLWVWGDRARIQQVVTNLLTNAIKYSADRREALVAVTREGAEARVSVTDYGIGIPEDQQSQVFELYYRASNVFSTGSGGVGLGLFISKYIVDRHGGRIGVRSAEGEGSTFYFTLPIIGADGG